MFRRTLLGAAAIAACSLPLASLAPGERLFYHEIKTDPAGKIVPWSGPPSQAYDHVVRRIWNFWHNMEKCDNGCLTTCST